MQLVEIQKGLLEESKERNILLENKNPANPSK
jgi:hypothetical protein